MDESASEFRARLIRRTRLSPDAVSAAWPDWWSKDAADSPSAAAELRFSLARKLGLDPRSLFSEEDAPRFVWDDAAKFKNFSGDRDQERPAIASFGTAFSGLLLQGVVTPDDVGQPSAIELRRAILANSPFVGLRELLSVAWGLGVPVVHLKVYPLSAKRMSAMSVRVGDRYAVLLAKDAVYPAPVAFYLAHELAHIFLGHLARGSAIVDMDILDKTEPQQDREELEADAFALELLTGSREPQIEVEGRGRSARQLAAEAARAGREGRIEPGTIAMTYGHATGNWSTAMAALGHIYDQPRDVWRAVNGIAATQITWRELSDDSRSFVRAVMGGVGG